MVEVAGFRFDFTTCDDYCYLIIIDYHPSGWKYMNSKICKFDFLEA